MNTGFLVVGSVLWLGMAIFYFMLFRRFKLQGRTSLSRIYLTLGILMATPVLVAITDSLLAMTGAKLSYALAVIPVFLFPIALVPAILGFQAWLSVLVADLARRKGRSWEMFFLLSIFVGPLIMWIAVASLSPAPGILPQTSMASDSTSKVDPDVLDQISKLGELKIQGLITEEEFEIKKSHLLSRL